MKKLVVVLAVCLFAAGVVFADAGEKATVKKDYSINVGESKVMAGTISYVTPSDFSRPNSKVMITDANGAYYEFVLRPSALIFTSTEGKLLTLRDLKTGDKVEINYRAKDDVNEAVAIKVVE